MAGAKPIPPRLPPHPAARAAAGEVAAVRQVAAQVEEAAALGVEAEAGIDLNNRHPAGVYLSNLIPHVYYEQETIGSDAHGASRRVGSSECL